MECRAAFFFKQQRVIPSEARNLPAKENEESAGKLKKYFRYPVGTKKILFTFVRSFKPFG
jgi:hypothetical protein